MVERTKKRNKYQENMKNVTGPTIRHPDYGEIFLLKPGEVPHSALFMFDVNKFWFIDTGNMIKVFRHHKKKYWYTV